MRADSPLIRTVKENELSQLLELYAHLHATDAPRPSSDELLPLWQSMCRDPNLMLVAAELNHQLVATCVLAIVPNLTRGARPFAVIENVVTHTDFRKRGLGTAVLRHAIQEARSRKCYKIMLLTGSKRPETLRFYEQNGFVQNVKTGFVLALE